MIICRQGKVFWIKVSKMQERRDADVGEIENYGEEQECRKKTKTEREVKAMKKIVAMICLITLLCMSTCVAFAEETLNFEEMVTENQIARIGEKKYVGYCGVRTRTKQLLWSG